MVKYIGIFSAAPENGQKNSHAFGMVILSWAYRSLGCASQPSKIRSSRSAVLLFHMVVLTLLSSIFTYDTPLLSKLQEEFL